MDFLGFGMARAFIYQASCRPRLFMLVRFFPSIKYNYIFAFATNLARNQLTLAHHYCFGNKNPHNFTQIFPEFGKKANLIPKKTHQAFWLWVIISFHFWIFRKILGQNPSKIWAKYHLGQNVLFGQIVTLGLKSLGKMSSWANCHIGHKVFGQYVTMDILSLGILKTWAFCHSI